MRNGLINLAFCHQGRAQIVMGLRIFWRDPDSFFILGNGRAALPSAVKDNSKVVARLCIGGIKRRGLCKMRLSLRDFALPGKGYSKVIVSLFVVRVELKRYTVVLNGFICFTLISKHIGEISLR